MTRPVTIPPNWRSIVDTIPDKVGLLAIANAFGICDDTLIRWRHRNPDLDLALQAKLKYPRLLASSLTAQRESVPPPTCISPDTLLDLRRLSMDHKGEQRQQIEAGIDAIEALLKERRHHLSQINQLKHQVHAMKRGGATAAHANGGK